MDESTMTQINETEKKAVKHRGKTIAILVLSVLLAASVTLNITGLVRGHGMRTAMNSRIEQFDGGQMQGQMPNGNGPQGQAPENGPQSQTPGNGPQGQAPDGQQNSQKSDNKKSGEDQKQDNQQNKGSADEQKSTM